MKKTGWNLVFVVLGMTLLSGLGVQAGGAQSYASGNDLRVGENTVNDISSGRDIYIAGSTVQGSTTAGRSLQGKYCSLSGAVSVGRSVNLDDCHVNGNISAGGDVLLDKSTVTGNVKAGHQVMLTKAKIGGSVVSPHAPMIHDSEISGTLHITGSSIEIHDSTIGSIKISSGIGHGFQAHGRLFLNGGTMVASRNGRPVISIEQGGVANVNGYTVRAMPQKTLVIVPDGSVYENGEKVSGKAEEQYTAYYKAHPDAPGVQGPGWQDAEAGEADDDAGEAMVVLTLLGNTRIQNDVVFENLKGKVILSPGAHVDGDVINGMLERSGQ